MSVGAGLSSSADVRTSGRDGWSRLAVLFSSAALAAVFGVEAAWRYYSRATVVIARVEFTPSVGPAPTSESLRRRIVTDARLTAAYAAFEPSDGVGMHRAAVVEGWKKSLTSELLAVGGGDRRTFVLRCVADASPENAVRLVNRLTMQLAEELAQESAKSAPVVVAAVTPWSTTMLRAALHAVGLLLALAVAAVGALALEPRRTGVPDEGASLDVPSTGMASLQAAACAPFEASAPLRRLASAEDVGLELQLPVVTYRRSPRD